MKLYLVHCGFYDLELCDGIYEGHVNLFVAATSFDDAKTKVRLESEFKGRKMHIDGLQEVEMVGGYRVNLIEDHQKQNQTILRSNKHRDL